MRTWILPILLLSLILGGCRQLDDEDDSSVNEDFTPVASNCTNSLENAYGCYGSDKTLGNEDLDTGVWSVYARSYIGTDYEDVVYDTYVYGYRFLEDGTAFERDATASYSNVRSWGIDDDGASITISDRGTYTITGQFTNDECFEVTNDTQDETMKLCPEPLNDTSESNGVGYIGGTVTFGNYVHGDWTVAGDWTVEGYSSTSQTQTSVALDADGTTSNDGEWGVSDDGKWLQIDDDPYLVYKYFKSSDCIAVFELSGEFVTSRTLKLCKDTSTTALPGTN